jgi:hypothetical protein
MNTSETITATHRGTNFVRGGGVFSAHWHHRFSVEVRQHVDLGAELGPEEDARMEASQGLYRDRLIAMSPDILTKNTPLFVDAFVAAVKNAPEAFAKVIQSLPLETRMRLLKDAMKEALV